MELKFARLLFFCFITVNTVSDALRLEPQTAEVAEGQPHTFTCQGQPNKVIYFVDDNRSLVVCIIAKPDTGFAAEGYPCGVSARDNSVYTMTIASVKRDDDSEKWYCRKATTKSNFATLRVKYRPEINFSVNGNPGEYVALEGDQVEFECRAEGYPPPSVTLFKNDNSLKRSTEGTLKHVIPSAACRDIGAYSCEAENTEGTRRSELKLQVKCKPVMVDMQQISFEASIQGRVTLQVQALAYPPPHFTWYSPSGFIRASENGTLISDLTSESHVVIDDITEDDFGEYHVIVANELGKANTTVSLRLKDGVAAPGDGTTSIPSSSVVTPTDTQNQFTTAERHLPVIIGLGIGLGVAAMVITGLVVVLMKKRQTTNNELSSPRNAEQNEDVMYSEVRETENNGDYEAPYTSLEPTEKRREGPYSPLQLP